MVRLHGEPSVSLLIIPSHSCLYRMSIPCSPVNCSFSPSGFMHHIHFRFLSRCIILTHGYSSFSRLLLYSYRVFLLLFAASLPSFLHDMVHIIVLLLGATSTLVWFSAVLIIHFLYVLHPTPLFIHNISVKSLLQTDETCTRDGCGLIWCKALYIHQSLRQWFGDFGHVQSR